MWREILNFWKEDNLMDQAYKESYEMLEIDEEMLREGIRILRESDDENVDMSVRKKDKTINKFERDVRKKILTHLAMGETTDLAGGLVLITIIIDIERIGDYAKNIFDLAVLHPERLKAPHIEDKLKEVESGLKDIFIRSKACLESSDEDAAIKLLDDYKGINQICSDCLDHLLESEETGKRVKDIASLTLYIRYLKRINSHLRNITSSVVNPFDRIGFKYKPK